MWTVGNLQNQLSLEKTFWCRVESAGTRVCMTIATKSQSASQQHVGRDQSLRALRMSCFWLNIFLHQTTARFYLCHHALSSWQRCQLCGILPTTSMLRVTVARIMLLLAAADFQPQIQQLGFSVQDVGFGILLSNPFTISGFGLIFLSLEFGLHVLTSFGSVLRL